MSLVNLAVKAKRAIVRETAGAALRAKAERADNTETIAELASLRVQSPRRCSQSASGWPPPCGAGWISNSAIGFLQRYGPKRTLLSNPLMRHQRVQT